MEKIWKGIEIGGVKNDELLSKMIVAGIKIGTWVQVATRETTLAVSPKTFINFMRCEVGELGFKKRPTTTQLWEKVREIGGICPQDAGLHLRHRFLDQTVGSCLFVIMDYIKWPSPESKCIFCISCGYDDNHRRQLRFQICPVGDEAPWPLTHKVIIKV